MSSFTENHSFVYSFYCIICVLPFVISLPVNSKDDPFDKFIEFLSNNNCSMPKEIELPFTVTDSDPFSYLSLPLTECKSSEAVKANNEANLLCREVFEVIQNITCNDYKLNNSKIETDKLSTDVCQDFAAIQDLIPKQNEFLSRKFGDGIICKVMCTEKYEFLCKTLLWGYNTQAKLKNATEGKNVAVEAEKNLDSHPDDNEIPNEEIPSNLKPPKKALNKEAIVNSAATNAEPRPSTSDETANPGSSLSATEAKKIESENHGVKTEKIDTQQTNSGKTGAQKTDSGTIDTQKINSGKTDTIKTNTGKINESIKASKIIVITPAAEATSKSSNDLSGEIQNITDDESSDLNENNIDMPSKSSSKNDNVDVPTIDVNISASDVQGDEKLADIPEHGEDIVDVNKIKEKAKNIPNPTVHKAEEGNDLKKSGQEIVKQDEPKETLADLDSKGENPKENEIPNGENDSNLSEPTVPSIFPDKSEDFEQQPELKDPEQYNDSENDGDYAKQEYDAAFNPAPKKESNVKNTLNDASSQFSSGSNMQISNENYLRHESDVNRNFLPSRNYLPDQEDSHFFFYFLTIVLVLMAGYLIFHNKQKIIALIVEGRHERRRRSHGAGYKKLETK